MEATCQVPRGPAALRHADQLPGEELGVRALPGDQHLPWQPLQLGAGTHGRPGGHGGEADSTLPWPLLQSRKDWTCKEFIQLRGYYFICLLVLLLFLPL
jgi:hypothetical protein